MSNFETLIHRVHDLVESGDLNDAGLMDLGPHLGISRPNAEDGVYGEIMEGDTTYLDRVHTTLYSFEGLESMESHYDALEQEGRTAIGRAINIARREREPQQEGS